MNIEKLINSVTPEIYQRLVYATETGRWPEGQTLTKEQKEQTIQLVMLYQSRFNHDASHMSVAKGGEIFVKSKTELKNQFSVNQENIYPIDLYPINLKMQEGGK